MEYFKRYKILYTLHMNITNEIPLRIGGDKSNPRISEPDNPVVKDKDGNPIIPGSSLKGFYRGNLHRVFASTLDIKLTEKLMDELFGGSGAEENDIDENETTNESNKEKHTSPILFSVFSPEKIGQRLIDSRFHINIDRASQGVKNLFEVEYVYEKTNFSGKVMAVNLHPVMLGIFHTMKQISDVGLARLGGYKSRGYGKIKIEHKKLYIDLVGFLDKSKTYSELIPINDEVTIDISNGINFKIKDIEIPVEGEITPNYSIFGIRLTIQDQNLEELLNKFATLILEVIR